MRLTVKIRTLCLAGVAVVAVLDAGEALARGGGHAGGGGHWIGGGGRGQHWGGGVHGQHWGGVHGGRVGFGGARRAADFGGNWRRDHGRDGSYWGGYYGGGGVYYGDVGNYGDYAPDGPPAYGGGATIYAPNYYPAPGYQAPTAVYPPAAYPSYAPVVSYGSDPHIIHLPATRHRRARKSCNCRLE
jgi:hypothetical protein